MHTNPTLPVTVAGGGLVPASTPPPAWASPSPSSAGPATEPPSPSPG